MSKLEDKFIEKRDFASLTETVNELRSLKQLEQREKEMRSDFDSFSDSFTTFVHHTKEKLETVQQEVQECCKNQISKKVDKDEFLKALENKANKNSVATALHRKANKVDIEEQFKKLIRNNEFDQIIQLLENKASIDDIDRLESQFESQVKQESISSLIAELSEKATKKDLDSFIENQISLGAQHEKNLALSTQVQVVNLKNSVTEQFEIFRGDIHEKLKTKVDSTQMLDIGTKLSKKADQERVTMLISQNKNNLIDILESYKKDLRSVKEFVESGYCGKPNFSFLDSANNDIWQEIERIHKQRDEDMQQLHDTVGQVPNTIYL